MENIFISNTRKIPNFLKLLFFVEMWERFSYYGMRALLVLFLTSQLNMADKESYAIYSLFAAIGYALPVIGGMLADKLLGFRKMVLLGSIIITLGHILLGLMQFESKLIYLGLGLIAVGAGMFKGNITNLLGACYKDSSPDERSRGFTLFYVGVNVGAFVASIICGYCAHRFGWEYGFGIAGIGMTLGLITFMRFQYILGEAGLAPQEMKDKKIFGLSPFSVVLAICLFLSFIASKMLIASEYFANLLSYAGILMLMVFGYITSKANPKERRGLIALAILLVFLMFFFALEMQLASLINLFSERNIDKNILGFTVPASFSQAINPLSIIIFGSIFGRYLKFSKKHKTKKFMFGIFTMAICFFILYFGCLSADANGQVSYIYLIISITIMGIGELCVAPLTQEQAVLLAPKNSKGLVMGIVMLALAFSNLAGVVISQFMSVPKVNGQIDSLMSLEIYKAGFLNICLFNVGLTIIFLLFYRFINRTIVNGR